MKIVTKENAIAHPLEDVFDIESGTTIMEYKEVVPEPIVELPNYDDKDNEIEGKLEEIYSVAMTNVATIADEMDRVEGKYKARIGEVTATMLNVALSAVREKSALKMHKDKLAPINRTTDGPKTVNNNLVVASQTEILRMLQEHNKK